MAFRYLLDPLFLFCFLLYFVNRWILEVYVPGTFFASYLNDLICIPFWVPIMLFFMRKCGLRGDDSPPRSYEIIVPLILWSVAFEIWLPATAAFQGLATADHRDVLCYAIGAAVAGVWWHSQRSGTSATLVPSR